jgi:primosomal protein N' (replication factor Y)
VAAQRGAYQLLALPERIVAAQRAGLPATSRAPAPRISLVDMREELHGGNRTMLSARLRQAIHDTLADGAQALLYLNRRGQGSALVCRDCGHAPQCPRCRLALVAHQAPGGPGWLRCHSCGRRESAPLRCPACLSDRIRPFGAGTQRLVDVIGEAFPTARIVRWDSDSAGSAAAHQRTLTQIRRGDADVIVGTQMIAKGLDLPAVALVGIVAAEYGLYLPDFRAAERTFQLLTQVAGRAGRRGQAAHIVIQSYVPEHRVIRAVVAQDAAGFIGEELAFRRMVGYPPYARLVRFVLQGHSAERVRHAAEALAERLTALAPRTLAPGWGLIGPAPVFFAPPHRRQRWHLMLRSADPEPLLRQLELPPGWACDIDPVDVLS